MSELKALSAEDILNAKDVEIERVDVPEWGGYVYVRGLDGEHRDAFEIMVLNWKEKNRNMSNIRAHLVAWTACDKDGELLFGPSHVKALGKKSAKALDRVFSKAQELSGLREEDIKELEGN